jgi:glutathione S-transferase
MRLYYAPGACSLSPHIVAREGKLPVELSRITFSAEGRTTAEGEDFYKVNPKGGYVPAIKLDSGDVLAEGVAIIQYLADQSSVAMTPEKGSMDYYRMLEWLTYISSEVHKQFSPLYGTMLTDEQKAEQIEKIRSRMGYPETELGKHEYLIGDSFTIADAYFYTIMRWTKRFEISLEAFPNIKAFMGRMEMRDGVKEALKEEELEPLV